MAELRIKQHVNVTLWLLGIAANIGAVVTPLFPVAAPWLSLAFIGSAVTFWVVVALRLLRQRKRAASRELPDAFHADGTSYPAGTVFSKDELPDVESRLRKIEQASLALLVADRLATGGWSKTMVWRFVRSRKTLSPVGTLTGTYFAVEALRAYGYLSTKPAQDSLATNLARILTPDGVVVQSVQMNSAGVAEPVGENLRHTAAYFLLRTTLAAKPSRSDTVLASRISADVGARLKVESQLTAAEGRRDMMGSAFGTAALLAGMTWLPPSSFGQESAEHVRGMLGSFSRSTELSTLGHPAWGIEPGGAAASQTAAQWAVAWLLAAMVGWSGLEDETRIALAHRLLDLIEANLASVPVTDRLLPYSFSLAGSRSPFGESMLATATACHVATLLHGLSQHSDIRSRCKLAIHSLIARISNRGYDYATRDSLEEPFEGYLAWASALTAIRPYLYLYDGLQAKVATSRLNIAEKTVAEWESGSQPLATDESWTRETYKAAARIEGLLRDTGITPGVNGLYQLL